MVATRLRANQLFMSHPMCSFAVSAVAAVAVSVFLLALLGILVCVCVCVCFRSDTLCGSFTWRQHCCNKRSLCPCRGWPS